MPPFHDKPNSDCFSDPLERLVEAFVELSVPEGPEAATQRRLIAAMRNGGVARPAFSELSARASCEAAESRPKRSRLRVVWQPLLAAAGAIAVVVAGALLMQSPDESPISPGPSVSDLAAEGPDGEAAADDKAEAREIERIVDAIDAYLNAPNHRRPDRQAFDQLLSAILRNNPELARSEALRLAQERLTVALERPGVLSVGVGLLGTLSWTTYGRF